VTSSQVLVRTPGAAASRYSLLLTTDPDDVLAARRLRRRVVVGGPDEDRFDAFCDHLVVREDGTGEIVGTYRMLPPERAEAAGGLRMRAEFEIGALAPLRPSLVEVGGSCVHPDHRDGAVSALVRTGIVGYLLLTGHRWLAGRADVRLDDGGGVAAAVYDRALARNLAPPEYHVRPHRMWDPTGVRRAPRAQPPPLLAGYLRLGAWICGAPAHDPDLGRAGFPILLGLDHADQRYLRHFLTGGPS
jgi:putative hemolysin